MRKPRFRGFPPTLVATRLCGADTTDLGARQSVRTVRARYEYSADLALREVAAGDTTVGSTPTSEAVGRLPLRVQIQPGFARVRATYSWFCVPTSAAKQAVGRIYGVSGREGLDSVAVMAIKAAQVHVARRERAVRREASTFPWSVDVVQLQSRRLARGR